jgi:diadenosine tetraphosphatase ApaH/serine/threonine PP2A family protein phosphatase
MRLAVFADVHGNLPALEAVLADIPARGIRHAINLGDCVSGPLWPRESCALLMASGIPALRGNHDLWVGTAEDAASLGSSDAYAHAELAPAQRAWLAALPTMLRPAPGLLAFHGTPRSDTEYLLDQPVQGHLSPAPPALARERLGAATEGVFVALCAHSHRPAVVQLPQGGPLVVNPGSVGCPAYENPGAPSPHVSESGSPHARYAVLTLSPEGAARVELVALAYDWETAARRAEANGRPGWARALRTGSMA